MGRRAAAEDVVRSTRPGSQLRLRVDLHGVSMFGPGDERVLIRWEWVVSIAVDDGVKVSSAKSQVHFPAGAFGLDPEDLVALLEAGRSLDQRPDVIAELGRRDTGTR